MADDFFGNQTLFDEFERTDDRTDKILMSKLGEGSDSQSTSKTNGHIRFSSSSESEDETEPVTVTQTKFSDCEESEPGEEQDDLAEEVTHDKPAKRHRQSSIEQSDLVKKLQAELQKVTKERDRLKRSSRIINPSKYFKDDEGPALQIVFMNNGISSKYKHAIEDFCMDLMQDSNARENHQSAELRVTHSSICLDEVADLIPSPDEKCRQVKASTVIGCSQVYCNFLIDSLGWYLVSNNPAATEGWQIPVYQQVFMTPLPIEEEIVDEGLKMDRRPKASCWNCGESHNLRECQAPHNPMKIAENRRKFQTEMSKFGPKQSTRYHIEDDPRFSKYKAGAISKELRNALGLTSKDLPPYIYQMRVLGYPPGHMQVMQEECSGLSMFDKHGKEMTVDGEEDGEVDANAQVDYLDVKKLISFPGFNVQPERDCYDDYKKLGMPAMNPSQSIEMMSQQLSASKERGTKRVHRDSAPDSAKRKKTQENEDLRDMDLSDNEPSPRKKLDLSLSRADTEILAQSSPRNTTGNDEVLGIDQLEEQKLLLQQQLALAEGTDSDMQIVDSYDSQDDTKSQDSDLFIPPLPPTPVRPPIPVDTPPRTPPVRSRNNSTNILTTPVSIGNSFAGPVFKTPESQPALLRTPSSGGSLSMALGTPISDSRKAANMSNNLPEPSKFSVGITQHIPFENIPGATGTYEKMKNLLETIRTRQDQDSSKS